LVARLAVNTTLWVRIQKSIKNLPNGRYSEEVANALLPDQKKKKWERKEMSKKTGKRVIKEIKKYNRDKESRSQVSCF